MARINLKDGQLIITFKYEADLVSAVRSVTGRRYNADMKRWEVPAENVVECLEILEPLGFTAHLDVVELADRQRARMEKIQTLKTDPGLYTGNLPLYPFQKIGVNFLKTMPAALLADVPGLGKTIQTIAALENAVRVLVLCPASLKYSWEAEIKKWDPGRRVVVVDGKKPDRDVMWSRMRNSYRPAFYVANYELLLHDFKEMVVEWDAIVCDEATRISNPDAKTTKLLKMLVAKKKIALTGTPVSNSPVDLFSIIDWLSPRVLGSFYQFRSRYCIVTPRYYNQVVGYRNLAELSQRISPFILRRTKEEVLKDFPPKTVEDVIFHLSPKERKLYEGIRLQIQEEVEKLTVSGRTLGIVPVKMLRLKQATNHSSLISEEKDSSKLEALKDTLDPIIKNGDKAIVFTQFAEMAKILFAELAALGYGPQMIYGEIHALDRQRAVEQFNSDPLCKVIVMTEAGAYGLNLQAASYVVHYDAPWSIAKLMQREDRAHRIGQTKPVTVYNLIAKETIDEYVIKVLHKKQKISVDLLRDADRLEEMGLADDDIKAILRI